MHLIDTNIYILSKVKNNYFHFILLLCDITGKCAKWKWILHKPSNRNHTSTDYKLSAINFFHTSKINRNLNQISKITQQWSLVISKLRKDYKFFSSQTQSSFTNSYCTYNNRSIYNALSVKAAGLCQRNQLAK